MDSQLFFGIYSQTTLHFSFSTHTKKSAYKNLGSQCRANHFTGIKPHHTAILLYVKRGILFCNPEEVGEGGRDGSGKYLLGNDLIAGKSCRNEEKRERQKFSYRQCILFFQVLMVTQH